LCGGGVPAACRRPAPPPRLGDAPVRYVVGDHGADAGAPRPEFRREMAGIVEELRRALERRPGIEIENKGMSLAIHYRMARDPGRAREQIDASLVRLVPRVRLVPGKCVVNVVPAEAPHKGDALAQLLHAEHAEQSLYVGDDDTDEDVFRLAPPDRPLTVRIRVSRRSRAEYFVREQREVDDLLLLLAAHTPPQPAVRQAVGRLPSRAALRGGPKRR
jgi:trehalose 6-phosphate phosphatase